MWQILAFNMNLMKINNLKNRAGLREVKHFVHVLDSCSPRDCSPPGSSVHGTFQEEYWCGLPFPSPGDLPGRGIEPWVSRIVGRCFTV